MEQKTLQQQADEIALPVTHNAKVNLQAEFKFLDDRLATQAIHVQVALVQMLGNAMSIREIEAKNAMEEAKYQRALKQRADEEQRTRDLSAAQDAIAEANKPSLVKN